MARLLISHSVFKPFGHFKFLGILFNPRPPVHFIDDGIKKKSMLTARLNSKLTIREYRIRDYFRKMVHEGLELSNEL